MQRGLKVRVCLMYNVTRQPFMVRLLASRPRSFIPLALPGHTRSQVVQDAVGSYHDDYRQFRVHAKRRLRALAFRCSG